MKVHLEKTFLRTGVSGQSYNSRCTQTVSRAHSPVPMRQTGEKRPNFHSEEAEAPQASAWDGPLVLLGRMGLGADQTLHWSQGAPRTKVTGDHRDTDLLFSSS